MGTQTSETRNHRDGRRELHDQTSWMELKELLVRKLQAFSSSKRRSTLICTVSLKREIKTKDLCELVNV